MAISKRTKRAGLHKRGGRDSGLGSYPGNEPRTRGARRQLRKRAIREEARHG